MREIGTIFLVFIILAGSALKADKAESDLKIVLKTDKRTYHPSDKIKLTVLLYNKSRNDIYVYGYLSWGHLSSFTLHIYDEQGRKIEPRYYDDSITPLPSRSNEFVLLEPNHLFGTIRDDTTISDFNLGAGRKYKIIVEYHSPIPESSTLGLKNVWSRENEPLFSNPVYIRVLSE